MYKSPKPTGTQMSSSKVSGSKNRLVSPENSSSAYLADYLIQVSEIERKIELARQILVENRTFDAVKAFWRLDRREVGEISFEDFMAFLLEHNVVDRDDEELMAEFET